MVEISVLVALDPAAMFLIFKHLPGASGYSVSSLAPSVIPNNCFLSSCGVLLHHQ